jgi:hypothetical protein
MTYPPAYFAMRQRLLAKGARRVLIAPLWPHEWLAGVLRGLGPLVARTATAAERLHQEGGGQPILVVGHSAGGLLARLITSPEAFEGRVPGLVERVGAVVTLGAPHQMAAEPSRGQRAGSDATLFLDSTVPGAFFAPRIGYLSVASSLVEAAGPRAGFEPWWAGLAYSLLLGRPGRGILGDGMVPVDAAHLEGASQLTFDDVRHGHLGDHWYGDRRVLDRWWPAALHVWRSALAARAGELGSGAFDREAPQPLESTVAGWSSGSSSGS